MAESIGRPFTMYTCTLSSEKTMVAETESNGTTFMCSTVCFMVVIRNDNFLKAGHESCVYECSIVYAYYPCTKNFSSSFSSG